MGVNMHHLSEISENSFRDIALREHDIELYEFTKAIQILEYLEHSKYSKHSLDESVLSDIIGKVSGAIKKKIEFIKEVASLAGAKLTEVLKLFKNSEVFKIFKAIGFSIKKLGQMVKKGIDVYNNIQDTLAEKIYELGGVQYIRRNLHVLDEFFRTHPTLKKIGGLAVAGLLLYIWLNMSFTIDLEYSMDFKDIILALAGNFSLADLFASPSGITMLIYLATGMLAGLSVPWPGGTIAQIVGGVLFSAWRLLKTKKIEIEKPQGLKLGSYPKVKFN